MPPPSRELCVRAGVLILPSLLVLASHVAADNIFPTANSVWTCHNSSAEETAFCLTDNATLSWYAQGNITGGGPSGSPSGAGTQNIQATMDQVFSPTDLNPSRTFSPVYSGSGETDIIYQGNTISIFNAGVTYCNDAADSLECDQHYVVFNVSYFGSPATPTRDIICHETGHAVGLVHGQHAFPAMANDDPALVCMRNPIVMGSTTLGSLNIAEINGCY